MKLILVANTSSSNFAMYAPPQWPQAAQVFYIQDLMYSKTLTTLDTNCLILACSWMKEISAFQNKNVDFLIIVIVFKYIVAIETLSPVNGKNKNLWPKMIYFYWSKRDDCIWEQAILLVAVDKWSFVKSALIKCSLYYAILMMTETIVQTFGMLYSFFPLMYSHWTAWLI